jgi:DNA polymerase III delta prime subunit
MSTTPHVTLISGPPRTGKTIFAHALKERLYNEGNRVLVIDEPDPARFKEIYVSEKWDHIILTTQSSVTRQTQSDYQRRINVIVRTQQV